ncbi:Trigger factor [Polystyrenella longa]|uniref:Trigger factor n=1 Tax=Polystyrenella longa TaxID=2528007 RepID=A0A518CR34_9PLAN|nr:trigger factor [Polystyrenella longa]QDU81696.1 Trigger factor [Polystyrenella longa]
MTSEEETTPTEGAVAEKPKLDLDVKIENAGPCRKHISVKIKRDDIDLAIDESVKELSNTAAIPGFRVGHVPADLVRKRFKTELTDQVKQKLLVESLEQISEENEFDPINEPDIDVETLDIPEEGDFEYEFDVEVRPDFDLPNYEGLKIERPNWEISDEDINAFMKRYAEQYGESSEKDGEVAGGDTIVCSVEFAKEGEVINKMTDLRLQVRSTLRFHDAELKDFEKLVSGSKAGDKVETDIKISDEAEKVELRGETLKATFKITSVHQTETPDVDDELATRIGFPDIETFRKQVADTLERQRTYEQRQATRRQVLEKITESADWDLPENLVLRQVENALRREILEMQQAGFTRQEIQAHENQLRQNALTSTRQALKEHFVLDRIATHEDINVEMAEIDMEIQLMAMQSGENPRRARSRLVKSGAIENLDAQIRERKAIDVILSKAEFVDTDKKPDTDNSITAVARPIAGTIADAVEEEEAEGDDE